MSSADVEVALPVRAGILFAAYQGGERERIAELVTLLTPVLWQVARSNRLCAEAAEDAVQLAWLRLVENADQIGQPRAVLGWLVTTVRREAWRLTRLEARSTPTDTIPEQPDPASEDDPEESALLRESRAVLWRHVQQLSPRCQELLRVISTAERPDYQSLSRSLGMPVGSIGPTRGRCLAALRRSLLADPAWSS